MSTVKLHVTSLLWILLKYVIHAHMMCDRGHFPSLLCSHFMLLWGSCSFHWISFSFASIHTRLNSDLFGHLNIYPTPWSSGHPHVAGSEQQGAHHRCLPARHFLFLLPEACEWHEHCQRLPSLLSSLQTRLQELLHPRWHHLHQGHRWPYRPLRCQMLLLRHAPLSSL